MSGNFLFRSKKQTIATEEETIKSINQKFDKVPIEIRPILKLCFGILGIIFTEVDLIKCRELESSVSRRRFSDGCSRRSAVSSEGSTSTRRLSDGLGFSRRNPDDSFRNTNTGEDDLYYTPIPSMPFGAIRILWEEILNLHNDHNSNDRKKLNPYEPVFEYWTKFISYDDRVLFIKKAKEHIHVPYERRGAKRADNGLERFIQNIFGGGRKDESKDEKVDQSDANDAVNYIKDMLESIGLIKIIHVKPKNIMGVDDDNSDCEENIEEDDDHISQEEVDDWLDQHSVISNSDSVSTLSTSFSTLQSVQMDNFGWEEKKRQKLIKCIMKERSLDFIRVDGDLHRLYGLHLFQSSQSDGGFLVNNNSETMILLNQIMVSACFRQRERMQLDDSSSSERIPPDQQRRRGNRSTRSLIKADTLRKSNINDKSLWYSNRVTNRKLLEIMLDDASRYTLRLLPSHLMRADNIKDATVLLSSPAFTHGRVTVLYANECARRCQHDCEELRLRSYRNTGRDRTFKKIVIQSYLSIKNCLLAEHPIVDGEYVIGEHSTGEVGKALHKLAQGCSARSWSEDAIGLYIEALKYKKASYGLYHKSVANTLFMIGSIYLDQGMFPKTIDVFKEIYSIEEKIYGVDDMKLARTCKTIGILLSQMKEYEKSTEAYERALKIELSNNGQYCVEVAETFNTLGIVYGIVEENKKAIYCFKASLDTIQEIDERVDIDLASIHTNIANLYVRNKDYEQALKYYSKALDLEGNRENTARTYHSMGMANFNMDKYDDALSCFERSLTLRKATYHINDEDVARTLLVIARIYQIQGQHDKSIDAFKEAGVFIQKKFGDKSIKNADVIHNIGLVYNKKGDFKESLAYHKTALEKRRSILGENHKDVAESLQNIADILFMLNEQDEAMEYYEKALSVRRTVFGRTDADVASNYNNLGVMYYKKGDNEKSLKNFYEALAIRKEMLGAKDEKVGDTLHNMGLVYKNEENYDESLKHYQEALEIRKEKLGDGHPKSADTLYNIATLYTNKKDYENALSSYEDAIRAYKKAGFPDKHPSVSNTFSWIRYCKKKSAASKWKAVSKESMMKTAAAIDKVSSIDEKGTSQDTSES